MEINNIIAELYKKERGTGLVIRSNFKLARDLFDSYKPIAEILNCKLNRIDLTYIFPNKSKLIFISCPSNDDFNKFRGYRTILNNIILDNFKLEENLKHLLNR